MQPLVRTSVTGRPSAHVDDNWIDRLSSRYTVVILTTFTVLIGIASWVRTPMTCWFPKNYDKDERYFLQGQCWVQNAYYLPYTRQIPDPEEPRRRIVYYQFIPLILLAQALLFWLPAGVWHRLSAKSGLDLRSVLEMSDILRKTSKMESREKKMADITTCLDYYFSHRGRSVSPTQRKCSGFVLSISYLFVKFLYIANLILQVVILTFLLKTHFHKHAIDYFRFHADPRGPEDGQTWNSPVFPRVAFCDYAIRDLGNIRRYTAQCVLTYNIYMERLYLFFWFWIVVLLLLTGVDFFLWLFRMVLPKDRLNFIYTKIHEASDVHSSASLKDIEHFTNQYLHHDGALVLRLIAHNSGAITAADVTVALWDNWISRDCQKEPIREEDFHGKHSIANTRV